jgi:hypothetical protein
MTPLQQPGQGAFAALRQLTRPKAPLERCELCGAALAAEHSHLVEPANHRLLCSCDPCAILFSARQGSRFRRVPRDVRFLPDFRLTEARWDELHLPINLAFFFRNSVEERIVAIYPSPAGATESLLNLTAWQELEAENPILRELEPDVEALLVNRVGSGREHYRVPIDLCYKLVGLIRSKWRGLSGGAEVWAEIGHFFTGLKEQSGHTRDASHD